MVGIVGFIYFLFSKLVVSTVAIEFTAPPFCYLGSTGHFSMITTTRSTNNVVLKTKLSVISVPLCFKNNMS